MFQRKRVKQMVGCLMALTMVMTNNYVGVGIGNKTETVAYAAEELTYTVGNSTYSYKILDDGTVEITDYEGTDTEIVIPGEIDGKVVTSIGHYAFEGCSSLSSVKIPNSVTSIGWGAFSYCSGLSSVEIPSSVTSIGGSAFWDCSSLSSVEIPNSVTSIGGSAFSGCSSLSSVEIPNGVTSIGGSAFSNCSNLTKIEVDASNQNYKSREGVLFNGDMTEILQYPAGKEGSYVIPSTVTSIGWGAFEGCRSLSSVEIPNSVTSIGESAFCECSSLSNVEIPSSVTSIGDSTFSYCRSLSSVEIPSSVTSIGHYAFEGCSSLSSVEIPSSVTSIGERAFRGCSNLTKIEVDASNRNYKSREGVLFNGDMTEILQYPVGKEESSYVIPSTVTYIGGYAFSGCSSLRRVEIPSSVTSIKWYAFSGCSSLRRVEIPSSVTRMDSYVFEGCSSLTIYGEKDSYAEQYTGNIPFIPILSDDVTNIKVEYSEDAIGTDISLQTKQLTESDEEYKNIILTDKIVDSSISPSEVQYSAYDISLVDENNNLIQPNGTVTVKIPCPPEYDGENSKVYRVDESGNFTDMKADYQDGYMVFETNHFSTYLITETELVTKPDVIPGDANGDGETDIKDSALIKRYIAGWDVEINMVAADVDGDGDVTIKDSALIKRQLAGWE